MNTELQRVLELQPSWTWRNSVEMAQRGRLVRSDVAGWINDQAEELVSAIGIPADDLLVEGRDGSGRKTRVPWARYGSRELSPSATNGFYVVYLWAFDGSAVYLSLNQGTTDFDEHGGSVRKSLDVLQRRVRWARDVLADWAAARPDLAPLELQEPGEDSLGRGYELGNIAAIRYAVGDIPPDDVLLSDAITFARALGALYRARTKAPLPDEVPELDDLQEATELAAGKRRSARGAGFRQNKEERDLIEKHAEDMAAAHYIAQCWSVRRVGAPYDLELTRGTERWTVEVKGTTSEGQAVALTAGEVRHHRSAYPDNALVVVRDIVLDRSTSPPTVSGGVLHEHQPWTIDDEHLQVISYKYTVPDSMSAGSVGDATGRLA